MRVVAERLRVRKSACTPAVKAGLHKHFNRHFFTSFRINQIYLLLKLTCETHFKSESHIQLFLCLWPDHFFRPDNLVKFFCCKKIQFNSRFFQSFIFFVCFLCNFSGIVVADMRIKRRHQH